MPQTLRKIVVARIAVVMLLASLAAFSTLAKNVQYLPQSNPASYLSIASKMKTDCAPVTVEAPPVERDAISILAAIQPEPSAYFARTDSRETRPAEIAGSSVSVRRRPPPALTS
jgi:hypothetical protein